jgi:hypothetical protein
MTVKNEGGIVTKDLAFLVDAASTSSFKGTPANNLASILNTNKWNTRNKRVLL